MTKAARLDREIAAVLKRPPKTTEFLGPCDRVRRKSPANEAKWHAMMARAQPVPFKVFTTQVDMTPMLEEDETPGGWWAEQRRSDPTTGAYRSWWGDVPCWFVQTAGFEFIFVDRGA